jgi:hypothetical protein
VPREGETGIGSVGFRLAVQIGVPRFFRHGNSTEKDGRPPLTLGTSGASFHKLCPSNANTGGNHAPAPITIVRRSAGSNDQSWSVLQSDVTARDNFATVG